MSTVKNLLVLGNARVLGTILADNISGDIIHYGVCSTEAISAAKVVTISNFNLSIGSEVSVKFSVRNTADNPTLNVSATGAKPITYKGVAVKPKLLEANSAIKFVYDGTNWEIVGSAGGGSGCGSFYGVSNTSGSAPAKTVTVEDFELATGVRVSVKFASTNTATAPTLNVSSSGDIPMMFGGVAVPSNYLNAGFVYEFCYDGTNWEMVSGMGAVEAILDALIAEYTAAV